MQVRGRCRYIAVAKSDVLEVDGILQTRGGVSVRATDVRRPVLPRLGTVSRDFH